MFTINDVVVAFKAVSADWAIVRLVSNDGGSTASASASLKLVMSALCDQNRSRTRARRVGRNNIHKTGESLSKYQSALRHLEACSRQATTNCAGYSRFKGIKQQEHNRGIDSGVELQWFSINHYSHASPHPCPTHLMEAKSTVALAEIAFS